MLLVSNRSLERLRRKAPQLIVAVIAIIVAVYLLFEILEDVVIGAPMTSDPLIGAIIFLTHDVTGTVRSWGYSGIFVLMLLESSSLPIPSEVILPFAGYLAFLGQLNVWIIAVLATVAGLVGSLIDYYIGLKGVQSLTQHKVLGRVLISTNQLEVAGKWFKKNGALTVFVSRLIPGFRTTFSFPAGAAKMSLPKFIAYTTAGCLLMNVILIYTGWFLGKNWTQVAGISRYLIIAAVFALVIVVAVFLVNRRRKEAQAPKSNDEKKNLAVA
jgi:membrane protein DedA with SNARE-associated domain